MVLKGKAVKGTKSREVNRGGGEKEEKGRGGKGREGKGREGKREGREEGGKGRGRGKHL